MINTETDARRWLRKQLAWQENAGMIVIQSIESAETSAGIFDLYVAPRGTPSSWVELKVVRYGASNFVRVPWREGQLAWAERIKRVGVKTRLFLFARGADLLYVVPSGLLREDYTWGELEYGPEIFRFDATKKIGQDLFSMLGGK